MDVDRYRLLADPTRRHVLAAVAAAGGRGVTAGELAASLGLGRSLVSYHLARLQAGGLVIAQTEPADRRRHRYVARVARQGPRGGTPAPAPASPGAGSSVDPRVDRSERSPAPVTVPAPEIPVAAAVVDPSLRARLVRYLSRRTVEAGDVLFWQGDPASGIWFVESGAVRVYTSDAEGREQTLQIIRAGESLNEVPFFDRGPEPATAQVLEAGVVHLLPVERRDAVLREFPSLAAAATASFAIRLRQTVALVEDLRFRQVAGRVARVLLQAVEPHPGVGAGSAGRSLTQREIAEMAGTSREVVARALRELERRQLIRVERGRIVLLDAAGLSAQD